MKPTKTGLTNPNGSLRSTDIYAFGLEMGRQLKSKNRTFIYGSISEWLEAVCTGVTQSSAKTRNTYNYLTISIGMCISQNSVLVNAADTLFAASGGAGTLSKFASTWQKRKLELYLTDFGGRAGQMASRDMDASQSELQIGMEPVETIKVYWAPKFPAHS